MHLPSRRDLLPLMRVLLRNQSPQLHHTYLYPTLLPSVVRNGSSKPSWTSIFIHQPKRTPTMIPLWF